MSYDYLSAVQGELVRRFGTGYSYIGQSANRPKVDWSRAATGYLQSTYPAVSGARPKPQQYTTVQRNQAAFDAPSYSTALKGWLRGNSAYADWNDQEIAEYVQRTLTTDPQVQAADEFWTGAGASWRAAGERAEADRAAMLGELATFKAGFGPDWINQTLQQERAQWTAQISAGVQKIVQQYAAQGRQPNSFVLGGYQRAMVRDMMDSLAVRRLELEREQRSQMLNYLNLLSSTYQNTQYQTVQPGEALQIVQALGSGAARVAA